MAFLIVAPLLVFLLLVFRLRAAETPFSHAVVTSFLLCSLLVHLYTEILSTFSLVNSLGVSLAWLLTLAAFLVLGFHKTIPSVRTARIFPSVAHEPGLIVGPKLIALIAAIVLLGTLVSAIFGAPNSCDALIYHMPRVLHWAANENVSFYPTHIQRQLTNPPLFEYWLLHLVLLTGSDRLFNLVQYASFASCIALSAAIAREIGVKGPRIWIAPFFAATLPIAILQASSPKNDLFFAFHICCFACTLLMVINRFSWPRALLAGASMGLSLASKGTAFLFIPAIAGPLGLYWLIAARTRSELQQRIVRLAAVAAIGMLLASPHMIRSYIGYGSVSSSGPDRVTNRDFSPSALVCNAARMAASNMATPFPAINRWIQGGMESCLGRELHNEGNIYLGNSGRRFKLEAAPTETKMANPLHFVAWIVCCLVSILNWRRAPRAALLGISSGMMFLSLTAFVQWSEWVTRLHLPFLLLGAPLLAMFSPGRPTSRAAVTFGWTLVGITSVLAGLCSFLNVYRPIIPFRGVSILTKPRYDQFFMYDNRPRHEQLARKQMVESATGVALAATEPVDDTRTVGLVCSPVSTEYLWWKAAERLSQNRVLFRHVCVGNDSARFGDESALPHAIVIASKASPGQLAGIESQGYRCTSAPGGIPVYVLR